MPDLCESAIERYLEALKGTFEVVDVEGGCLLITPFMRPDNESIEIELSLEPSGNIRITDNGDTMDYLFVNGLSVRRSAWLRRRLNSIAARSGVRIEKDEVSALSEPDSLGQNIQALLSAIQDVTYLIYRREERGKPTFDEEVERFLIRNGISYDERYPVRVTEVRTHTFRFHTNGTGDKLLEPLTATTPHAARVKADRLALWWVDVGKVLPGHRRIAIVDDVGPKAQLWDGYPTEVLRDYSDHVVLWHQSQQLMSILTRG